jgi:hypothetical protein
MLLLMLISSDCRFSRCRLQFDRKLQSTSHQLARARYKQILSDRKGADIASGVPLGAAPDRRADRLHIRLLRLDLAILDHSMPTRQLIATNGGSGCTATGCGLDLDFQSNLDDLRSGHTEIGGREVSVEMHRREQPLPPHCHPGYFAARNDHHAAEVIGDLLWIDAV